MPSASGRRSAALSADGVVTVAVLKAKRSWKVLYASSSLTPDAPLTGKQKLSPLSAWLHAARAAGIRVKSGDASVLGKTADGALAISALGVSGAETVAPIAFGTPRHGALRAYDTTVTRSLQGSQDSYRVIVDAATGKLLYRQNQVFNLADNPTWKGFQGAPPFNPMNAYPWNYPSTDTRDTFCWTATAGCTIVVGTTRDHHVRRRCRLEAPVGRPARRHRGEPRHNATEGNNVDDARVWSRREPHGVYGNPALLRASSATRDYQPAWTNAWFNSQCNPDNVNAAINPTGNDIEASAASMFVGHNRMHDFSYYLGFDEGHWNAQQYNNGVATVDPTPTPGGPTATPVGNDGLIGNAQSGAATGSRDNANMNTGADGGHPTTNQFVWQPLAGSFYAPCVDGAYDFSVYGHEFGHLIENRMIGKGVGARQGTHAGSMGEAFGDFDALEVQRPARAGPPAPTATPRAPTRRATATTASATSSRAGRWAASSRRRARIPTPTRSTTATSASTSSGPRCTPTARSGSRSRSTCATCSCSGTPPAGTPRTSPASAGSRTATPARATGAGSRTTTTRW